MPKKKLIYFSALIIAIIFVIGFHRNNNSINSIILGDPAKFKIEHITNKKDIEKISNILEDIEWQNNANESFINGSTYKLGTFLSKDSSIEYTIKVNPNKEVLIINSNRMTLTKPAYSILNKADSKTILQIIQK
jgi:hypothetical protein